MTPYDITRLADAIVEKLTSDERFLRHLAKMIPKRDRLLTSAQAAELLGVSRFTIRRNAEQLGGELNAQGRWMFHESGLIERYKSINR